MAESIELFEKGVPFLLAAKVAEPDVIAMIEGMISMMAIVYLVRLSGLEKVLTLEDAQAVGMMGIEPHDLAIAARQVTRIIAARN